VTAADASPRLIVVEDSELDYELLIAMLTREGLRARAVRVEDEAGMRDAFAQGPVDAVITDHNLPRFDSLASLKVAKDVDPDIPVLVLSGEMSEELAVASLHAGADDFVLKTRMFRVAAALQHSLAAARTRREARNAAVALVESERKLHALTQHLERAKEEERRAIAQEIHDDVGGALTALKFEVVRLAREVGTAQHAERMRAIQQLLESAVVATHRIQHALRPAVLDAGLVAALEWLTRGFGERTGLPIDFRSNRDEFEIAPDRAAALYRVAQEAPTNVRKHAGARSVNVQLLRSTTRSRSRSPTTAPASSRTASPLRRDSAYAGSRAGARARRLGGSVPPPGRGTTVMFSIPPQAAPRTNAAAMLEEGPVPVTDRRRRPRDRAARDRPGAFRASRRADRRRSIRLWPVEGRTEEAREPDVLVMDVGLPGKNGIEILSLRGISAAQGADGEHVSGGPVRGARVQGRRVRLSQQGQRAGQAAEVVMVIAGKKYVTPEIAQALIENLNAPEDTVAPHEKLSDREFQTLRLMASGKRLSDIAEELALSPKTVSVYRARILEKMGMSNNAELTHYAIKHGLVE
jgi:DNA-binding NarL/FixJ family response regulator